MFDFLEKHYSESTKLFKDVDIPYTSPPTDDLSYGVDEEEFQVGFNYNTGDIDRAYIWRLCQWMAVMD